MTSNKPRLEVGVHDDLSNDAYHGDKTTISKSHLDQVDKSPAHYRQWLTEPTDPTTDMIFGSAAHMALLEPEKFPVEVLCAPESAKTRAAKAYKDLEEANPNKIILTFEEYRRIQEMTKVAKAHPVVAQLLSEGFAERSLVWEDQETGLRLKARADYWRNDNIIIDYKTTQDASPKEFQRSIEKYRYDVQGAMYLSGMSKQMNQVMDKFVFIAQEKKAPYAIAIYVLDDATLEVGEKKMRKNLTTLAECFRTNKWPAYPEEFQSISLPAWAWPSDLGDGL